MYTYLLRTMYRNNNNRPVFLLIIWNSKWKNNFESIYDKFYMPRIKIARLIIIFIIYFIKKLS